MKLALVHDYLAQDGGAERVLKALHEIWPEAPIFVLFHDQKKINCYDREKIKESFLTHLPFIKSSFQWYLPWMPMATERHDLSEFNVVISSSSVFAKGIITSPQTLHISYCHTPARFLWADSHEYLTDLKRSRFVKIILPNLLHRLRLWDQMSMQRVDNVIANSETVRKRINKYYRRDSQVLHPPVDTHLFSISNNIANYFVAGGRLVPYKRLDLVIKVFNRLQQPLKIFGTGPELPYLKKIAKDNVEFLGKVTEAEKANLLSHCQAFIHPQLEDFGITPVEAMSAGRPVIAYGVGGATETIIPGETGVFFHKQNWESLLETVINFEPNQWDTNKIREQALKFNNAHFKEKIQKYVIDHYEEFNKGLNQTSLAIL
ncbi:MAG: Glycosyl transferase group 1 [Candidatus Magasanikbacteria bacterium GW2011_GWC2_34_16]|uniref:Glycosyl transferase group 1 n=2 Tax=Candidatus Magasanikiibacteriota TaxID=1752731 RepID=A0A0G0JWK7_9BACT|nr:MAG: Glycosyl transferase group 1 [Candidatus Magasanikbacteria bacterium GW2011_GWC2_34_16]KKQ41229.1 MAG: Glycosyl transferase group 1 [Candidatus Magasanikbacteria bacterium GW2011_GWA2_37_8]